MRECLKKGLSVKKSDGTTLKGPRGPGLPRNMQRSKKPSRTRTAPTTCKGRTRTRGRVCSGIRCWVARCQFCIPSSFKFVGSKEHDHWFVYHSQIIFYQSTRCSPESRLLYFT